MKQYRGYYIDNVIFHSREEIDEKIKADGIRRMQKFVRMGLEYTDVSMMMAAFAEADRVAEFLISKCGMTRPEVMTLQNV